MQASKAAVEKVPQAPPPPPLPGTAKPVSSLPMLLLPLRFLGRTGLAEFQQSSTMLLPRNKRKILILVAKMPAAAGHAHG